MGCDFGGAEPFTIKMSPITPVWDEIAQKNLTLCAISGSFSAAVTKKNNIIVFCDDLQ